MEFPVPPPPYREVDSNTFLNNNLTQFRVARKPVCTERPKTAPSRDQNIPPIYFEASEELKQARLVQTPPPLPERREVSSNTFSSGNIASSRLRHSPSNIELLPNEGSTSNGLAIFSATNSSSGGSPIPSTKMPQSSASSYVQQAFHEARHFAGGLITHPVESTNHFTILRHSHGLVFYQGANTALAISIFSDLHLLPDRTIWLQSKGWSGKTGMRARAFMGRNGSWINVTPSLNVGPEQLRASDERAWQRDIAHFRKKPKNHKQQYHTLRETAIVRIPEDAEDGYFQFVLCLGDRKKVLCPSPVFRVLPTTTDPSSIRGASLTTLPLELGVIAFGTYARNTAGRVVGPVAAVIQSRDQKVMPSWVTQQAAATALSMVKPSDNLASDDEDGQHIRHQGLAWAASTRDTILDEGPQPPYPLRFVANSEPARIDTEQFNMPAIALNGISASIAQSLLGFYLGWARFVKQPMTRCSKTDDYSWHPAVISALPMVAFPDKTNVVVRLPRDYEDWSPDRQVIEIRLLGFIRPDDPIKREALQRGLRAKEEEAAEAVMLAEMNDILVAENILDRPAWNPDAVFDNKTRPGMSGGQSPKMVAQRHIGKVPFHRLGVRSPVDGVRETSVAVNGYYVRR